MALQGTLKDFPIADIFQLIGQQRKTGVLVLKKGDEEVRVFFHEGKIFKALPAERPGSDLLGDMLVRAELISEEQLEDALAVQRKTLQRLGDILVDRGLVDKETIQKIADLQTTETVYELFNWKEGTYHFQAKDLEMATDLAHPIPAENVLMEGIRRLDEWPMVRQKVPDMEAVFEKVVDLDLPGEGLKNAKADKNIGENERKIYKLLDGYRTVQELADLSLLGGFEASKALWNLINAGYVRKARKGDDKDDESDRIADKLPGLLVRGTVGAIFTLMVVVVVVVAVFAVLQAAGRGPVALRTRKPVAPRLGESLVAKVQRERLTRAIEAYALYTGSYPEKLDDLLVEQGLEKSDLNYPWESKYYYERTASGGFLLLDPKY